MIRSMKPDELDAVMRIWLDGNRDAHGFIPPAYWDSQFDTVKSLLPHSEIYVCETVQGIDGFLGLTDDYIAGLFVRRRARSTGIGKQLMDRVKEKKERLTLQVYCRNERAVRFYLRERFQIQSEQTDKITGELQYLMLWRP